MIFRFLTSIIFLIAGLIIGCNSTVGGLERFRDPDGLLIAYSVFINDMVKTDGLHNRDVIYISAPPHLSFKEFGDFIQFEGELRYYEYLDQSPAVFIEEIFRDKNRVYLIGRYYLGDVGGAKYIYSFKQKSNSLVPISKVQLSQS